MAKKADGGNVVVPILEGEDPWTADELEEIREDLVFDVQRMERALATSARGLERLFDEGTEGAGRDPADVGSSNFERDQEMSLAQNARDLLDQAQTALRLFDAGEYGWCESCGEPIGKDRLMAFPRATMCVTCKQREERR
ncbi:TraR/DksA family transcriptional regulator [Propioniciclava sp.]|uniref:TraR/DksA family transcriptional regulator n=1 Tax=Propioniciclava sp. TaxID=2038686 RepID=UPI0026333B5D|nr:TraR/DksA family transcriptional regulator [Propioniciclava sp.]